MYLNLLFLIVHKHFLLLTLVCLARYLHGLSKNYKMDINHCNVEAMHQPIDCLSQDIINTYKIMRSHWSNFSVQDIAKFKPLVQPLFLHPKLNVRPKDIM